MNFDITPDDFTTYIIMFWFVAMPVGLVWSLWWNLKSRHKSLHYKLILEQKIFLISEELNIYKEQANGLLKVLQGHTAAIAKLEDSPKSKPPKSLKDKVLAASKRTARRR